MIEMNIRNRLELSRNAAMVSGIFCVAVALLLLLNYWQVSRYDPLESKAMEVLVQRLAENPDDDALKNDIRNLDLLARKAYFNSRWQVTTGSYLLLFGAVVFALALRVYHSLKSKIELPDQKQENELASRILAQRWVILSGAGLLALALVASLASVDHLKSFGTGDSSPEGEASVAADPGIEVIEVGEEPVLVTADTSGVNGADTTQVAVLPGAAEGTPGTGDSSAVKEIVFPDAGQLRANHPSFRGPMANGVSGRSNIPLDFDGPSGKNILWKVAVPLPGTNSPVIWGDRLFVTGANAQKREVYCFDRYGGKLLWTAPADKVEGSPATPPRTTEDTGLAAPSVTTDGIHVYAIFGTGDILALDYSGKRVWARNLGVPDNHYGHSSSLVAWKNKVYVQYDTNKAKKLIALDALTGKTVWETTRNVKISWASPILANIGGRMQVVLAADPLLAGYDAETGKELWHASALAGEVGPSPAYGEGLVFGVNEYASLAAVNPSNGQVVWKDDEYLSEVASPVVANGLLFIATSYGVLVCYDAKNGEKLWEADGGVGYYSSPVIADGKLFLFNTDGLLQVYALEREMNLLAEAHLGTKVYTTPAFANNRMFVRAGGNIYCIGIK
ncbi:MAG TPA: PQQ-like beta-propeller repeat protein [Prolixibacteraceae bacterium]|nr:PQQ-like beta-propeller repeat protein [Prolixibacteraceae bacterium]HRV88406.1 PQQ-like beta-propeller repeat protein [Prolixibacteraceae bacterium]